MDEALRPTETQIPERDLSFADILPLDDIGFDVSSNLKFGALRQPSAKILGFPEGTVPGWQRSAMVYFYDEFMHYIMKEAEVMMNNPSFIYDMRDFREDRNETFRDDIKEAPMTLG